RDSKSPGGDRPQNAQLARSDDVDEIGRELTQAVLQGMPQALKGQVEAKVRVHADRQRTASLLHHPERIMPGESLVLPEAHAEEGITPALCEGGKLAAGARSSVYLVKGVREKSDAGDVTLGSFGCRLQGATIVTRKPKVVPTVKGPTVKG